MENGRQLKIQRWIEEREKKRKREMMRKRNRERERNESRRERYMREKGKKDRKRQTVGRILQRSAHPFPTRLPLPPAKNNGRRMCLLFHFWIHDHSCSLVFAFPSFLFPIPLQAFSYPCSFVFLKTRTERKRASQGA